MSTTPATAERRLAAITDLSPALSGAAMALELAVAGADALDQEDALPDRYAEGLQYLARHVAEMVESMAAVAQDRPPRWRLGMTFDAVRPFGAPSGA
jgi:hypothetical protein